MILRPSRPASAPLEVGIVIRPLFALVLMALSCLVPALGSAGTPPETTAAPHSAPWQWAASAGLLPGDAPAAAITGAGWWQERKKRFQEVAVCALSSANVTYLLLTGFSGPGAVIGFSVSLLGVIVCL